jgi:phosphohistidine phosphatase SixA
MPLFIKQFKIGGDRWQNEDGAWSSEYAERLFKNANFDIQKIVEQLNTEYRIGVEGAINPEDLAKEQLAGIQRLQGFISKIFPGRDIVIGLVGHSPNLEILAQYLAEGKEQSADFRIAFPESGIMRVDFARGNADIKLPEQGR